MKKFSLVCLLALCIIGVSLACQGDVLLQQGRMYKGVCDFVTGVLVSGVSLFGACKVYEIYYTSQTDDGVKYANIFLYHKEAKKDE